MFHAFLKKAEASNNTFEEILASAQDVAFMEEPPEDVKEQYGEIHSIDDNSEDELEYMIDEAFKLPKTERTDARSPQKSMAHEMIETDATHVIDTLEHNEDDAVNDGNESELLTRFQR